MISTNFECIDEAAGRWLVFEDFGSEGISLLSQHETIKEAFMVAANSMQPYLIALLPDIKLMLDGMP